MGAPRARDGKPYVSPNIFPKEHYRNICGRGDNLGEPNPLLARGTGNVFKMSHGTQGYSAWYPFGFIDPVSIAGGGLVPWGAQYGDTCSLRVVAPATPVVPAAGNGNCTLVDPGYGSTVMLVPMPGNGDYSVDLTQAVPIPWGDDWIDRSEGDSFWDWHDGDGNIPLEGRGEVHPNYEQKGYFNLFVIPIVLVTHAREVPLHGADVQQPLTIAAVESKLVLPHWTFEAQLYNDTGHAGLKASWWLDIGRARTLNWLYELVHRARWLCTI